MTPRTTTGGILSLVMLLSSAVLAGGYEDENERGWSIKVSPDAEHVRAVTHGTIIYGNEIGFVLSRPGCAHKNIWLSFVTYDLNESAEDIITTFELTSADVKYRTQVPLIHVVRILPNPEIARIAVFTNISLEPELAEFLRTYQEIEVRIVAPKWLVKEFDRPEAVFDVTGFAEAEETAIELCNARKT